MPELPKNATLTMYQKYVTELEYERGFINQTIIDKCLLLGEEVGELFKAVRKQEGLKIDLNSENKKISEELVDIFIYICAIANRSNVNLEKAFLKKEEVNKKRQWVTND